MATPEVQDLETSEHTLGQFPTVWIKTEPDAGQPLDENEDVLATNGESSEDVPVEPNIEIKIEECNIELNDDFSSNTGIKDIPKAPSPQMIIPNVGEFPMTAQSSWSKSGNIVGKPLVPDAHTSNGNCKPGIVYHPDTPRMESLANEKMLITRVVKYSREKPFKCETCGKSFNNRSHLTTHQSVHSGQKPYKCEVCNKCFSQQSNLSTHQIIHSGEKPHKCEICNKTFTQRVNLTTHQLTHTGEKRHECKVCLRRFTKRGHLTSHLQIHFGVRPFKCEICNKTFIRSSDLTNHLRVHTGERPYQCDKCPKRFIHRSTCIRHKNYCHVADVNTNE